MFFTHSVIVLQQAWQAANWQSANSCVQVKSVGAVIAVAQTPFVYHTFKVLKVWLFYVIVPAPSTSQVSSVSATMASSTQKQPTPLQKLRVDEIVVSDVGIAGDVAMKVSRALNLERANRVSGWRGLAARYFHHAPPINTRSCNASPSPRLPPSHSIWLSKSSSLHCNITLLKLLG